MDNNFKNVKTNFMEGIYDRFNQLWTCGRYDTTK